MQDTENYVLASELELIKMKRDWRDLLGEVAQIGGTCCAVTNA